MLIRETPWAGAWRVPSGYLAAPPWAIPQRDQVVGQWARSRTKFLFGMHSGDRVQDVEDCGVTGASRRGGQVLAGVAESLAGVAAHLGVTASKDVPVWEFDVGGRVRRGLVGAEGHDARVLADVGHVKPAEVMSGGMGRWREQQLADIAIDVAPVHNSVASYLGMSPKPELGWTTAAPATGRTPSWNGESSRWLTWSGHASSYAASSAAALVEGMERRVGALHGRGDAVLARGRDLPGRVLTPEDFPAYPDEFYGERGCRYSPDAPHEWVRSLSLTTKEQVWVPREFVFYGEQMRHERWALSTSSGCATGSSTAEAALFGLLELIERDAFLLSWYARVPVAPIRPGSVPGLELLLARAALLGYRLEVGLLQAACKLPAIVCVASSATMRSVGAACHPDPVAAVRSAIEEAWTYLPERERSLAQHAERVERIRRQPHSVADIDEHPLAFAPGGPEDYAQMCGVGEPEEFGDAVAGLRTVGDCHNAAELLEHLTACLGREEVEVLTCVQTTGLERSIGLETVMTLAPALVPIDFGWGNQRALRSPRVLRLTNAPGGSMRLLPHPFS